MLFLLTEYCTMGCKHCMINSTDCGKHSSFTTVKAFVKFAKKMGTRKIGISGGEPTQHPHFLKHLTFILKAFSYDNVEIVVMSNGHFLKDKALSDNIARLQSEYPFGIQITSIEGLYFEHESTIRFYELRRKDFMQIDLIKELYYLEEHLGRAKENDLSEFRTGNSRTVPNCFNLYAGARQLGSLKEVINYLDGNTVFNFCKPMVDFVGNVYPSECNSCPVLGNIHRDGSGKIYRNLVSSQPCGACKNMIPSNFKETLGWT